MTTADQITAYHNREIEARKESTISGLQPIIAEYRERRVHPEFKYERQVDETTSVFITLPGSDLPSVFLCDISRGWSQLGGQGWQFTHPINGVRSHKNRHDASFDCFRRLARNCVVMADDKRTRQTRARIARDLMFRAGAKSVDADRVADGILKDGYFAGLAKSVKVIREFKPHHQGHRARLVAKHFGLPEPIIAALVAAQPERSSK